MLLSSLLTVNPNGSLSKNAEARLAAATAWQKKMGTTIAHRERQGSFEQARREKSGHAPPKLLRPWVQAA